MKSGWPSGTGSAKALPVWSQSGKLSNIPMSVVDPSSTWACTRSAPSKLPEALLKPMPDASRRWSWNAFT